MAIVVAFTVCSIAFIALGDAPNWLASILGPGLLIAAVGALDDRFGLPPSIRLIVHFATAAWALWAVNGLAPIEFGDSVVDLGLLGNVLAVVGLVWSLNLFNFMDGIDGIASVETITVCLAGACLSYLKSGLVDWIPPMLLTAAAAGFLVRNFPPARIFMGDAGSCFLGFAIGLFCIISGHQHSSFLWMWLILLGGFVTDATVTLIRRAIRRERIWGAHRSHAYQHAAIVLRSHRTVTLGVGLINILWLFPIAAAVVFEKIPGTLGSLMAYVPLVVLAIYLNAGGAETSRKHSDAS
ncbi:MAG TPA: glycosyl transferase [Burkholderiales bacterium]|nr:glycosyl transferase [Burkholderiales bacterium]